MKETRLLKLTSKCKTCKGTIYRIEIIPGFPKKNWLHLYREDWYSNPHNAEPVKD